MAAEISPSKELTIMVFISNLADARLTRPFLVHIRQLLSIAILYVIRFSKLHPCLVQGGFIFRNKTILINLSLGLSISNDSPFAIGYLADISSLALQHQNLVNLLKTNRLPFSSPSHHDHLDPVSYISRTMQLNLFSATYTNGNQKIQLAPLQKVYKGKYGMS